MLIIHIFCIYIGPSDPKEVDCQDESVLIISKVNGDDKPRLLKDFFDRVRRILKEENVEFEDRVVAQFIAKRFPDFRKTLNELQKYSLSANVIDAGIFATITRLPFSIL